MSQRQFPNRRQKKPLRKIPHSQKSFVSEKKSQKCMKDVAELTTKLHNLTEQRDWARTQAKNYWKYAEELKAHGYEKKALEQKTKGDHELYRAQCYDKKVEQIKIMLDKLHLVGLQKGLNYAINKMKEPPSDNQSD